MGGNVSVNGYKAQKIPVKEIGLKKFQNDFKKLLKDLNKLFYQKNKQYIWNNEKIIDDSYVFNGSTSYLMDPGYLSKENELLNLKPTSGDIDVMVPEELKEQLWEFLKNIEGKNIDNFEYIGNNKPTISSIGEQINALFKYCYKKDNCVFAQIDFEFVPFKNDIPTEWSKFSHSSTFKDLKNGVKAVFHKYLLRSISHAVSQLGDVLFATKASKCDKIRISKSKKSNHFLKFSVSKGIRVAYEPMICNGEQVYIDGKPVYKELATSQSIFETDIKNIFKMLFGKEPDSSEEKDFWSFVGLLNLMKKYLNKKQIEDTFKRFLELLWETKNGKNIAQELERDNPELDYEIKNAAVQKFIQEFPIVKKYLDEKQIEEYYKNYGQRSVFKESYYEIIKGLLNDL